MRCCLNSLLKSELPRREKLQGIATRIPKETKKNLAEEPNQPSWVDLSLPALKAKSLYSLFALFAPSRFVLFSE